MTLSLWLVLLLVSFFFLKALYVFHCTYNKDHFSKTGTHVFVPNKETDPVSVNYLYMAIVYSTKVTLTGKVQVVVDGTPMDLTLDAGTGSASAWVSSPIALSADAG